MIDVVSIGAGGGSIAWVDQQSGLLQVGPRSAGAVPGPACYAQGGNEPTVTDANLVLGRIDAQSFFGGRKKLDLELARRTIRGKSGPAPGLGSLRSRQGHPRDCRFPYGRPGPESHRRTGLPSGRFCDLRLWRRRAACTSVPTRARSACPRSLVSPYAPVFSGFGIAGCDIQRQYTRSHPTTLPVPSAPLNAIFRELETEATRDAVGSAGELQLERCLDMKFRRQVHHVRIAAPAGELAGSATEALIDDFEKAYEKIYGKGTAYRKAGVEISNFIVTATTKTYKPKLKEEALADGDPRRAQCRRAAGLFRRVYRNTGVQHGVIASRATASPARRWLKVRPRPCCSIRSSWQSWTATAIFLSRSGE